MTICAVFVKPVLYQAAGRSTLEITLSVQVQDTIFKRVSTVKCGICHTANEVLVTIKATYVPEVHRGYSSRLVCLNDFES